MRITGSAALAAPVEAVWAALNDPAVLVRTIPGCEQLEEVGPDRYRMTVTAGVASITGTYDGEVALAEQQPPTAFVLRASGAGAPGTVEADVRVTLAPDGVGTRLEFDADAVVGGVVGGVGQRMLAGVARRTADEFFRAVDAVLAGAPSAYAVPAGALPGEQVPLAAPGAPVPGVPLQPSPVEPARVAGLPPVPHPAPAAGPRVFEAPPRPVPAQPWWALLAAFGAGAFWALAGVAVGTRVARRR